MAWAPDYATTAQVKAFLRISDTADDAEIATAISAASRSIDRACRRQFGSVGSSETRRYVAVWDRHRCAWVTEIDDLYDDAGLVVTVVNGSATVTTYTLEPLNV